MVREPTMKPTPASSRAFRLAAESMPAPGDYDQGLDLGGLAELFNDTDNRGGLSPIALPATNSQGEASPVDQQPDDDPGGAPGWCVERRWVVSVGCGLYRVSLRIMACRVRMRRWARTRMAWPKALCPGRVCAGSRPGRRGRSAARRRRRGTWRA